MEGLTSIREDLGILVDDLLITALRAIKAVPGTHYILQYIKSSYQNDPIRSLVEFLLFLFAVRYVLSPRQSSSRNTVEFSEKELDELVEEWQPEPLIDQLTEKDLMALSRVPVIIGAPGSKCRLSSGKEVLNLASKNFLNFASDKDIINATIETTKYYGVGACGPPGFYGTEDVHLRLEDDISAFLDVESTILYAQAYQTIQSVIPSFAKRGDVLIVDEKVNDAILKGVKISRSNVYWFKHNSMGDLERICHQVFQEQAKKKQDLTRRFIITEAIFECTGEIVDLATVVNIKKKYNMRLILDESLSIGVLGPTGRGLTEYQNVSNADVEMIVGALDGVFASAGGFCSGSKDIVEHQRTSALSYTFSASISAPQAVVASKAINLLMNIEPNPLLAILTENIFVFRSTIAKSSYVEITSHPYCPIVIMKLSQLILQGYQINSFYEQEDVLNAIVEDAENNGVLLNVSKYVHNQVNINTIPTLRAYINAGISKKEISKAASILRYSISRIIKAIRKID